MSDLFNSDEAEVMRVILRRMGQEMQPRGMHSESRKAYNKKVDYATERVMAWLEDLHNKNDKPFSSNGTSDFESGKSDSSDEFCSG